MGRVKVQAEKLERVSNIALLGFMGCGKTTVGRKVAERLGWRFFDTDALIEERMALSIPQIFSCFGEEYFRTLETEVLRELAKERHIVLATGGGLPIQEENREILRRSFFVVFLRVSFPVLLKRIQCSTNRPLLKKHKTPEALETLYRLRIPYYEQAHVIIDADFLTVEEVAEEIIRCAQDRGVFT
ncbi:MAG: shikimate kinase [Candidatus Caldatribacterium sp.]|nr:shikimate kinase [Candidatus Caldatribacterium sp.]